MPNPPKIEAQRRNIHRLQRLRDLKNDLIMHCPPTKWVRMANKSCPTGNCPRLFRFENAFQVSQWCGYVEVEYLADGPWVLSYSLVALHSLFINVLVSFIRPCTIKVFVFETLIMFRLL